MQTTSFAHDYTLSKLMLGTVQFGLPYGVANRSGQPTYAEVRAIVAAAIEGGVTCFDTAAAYGTSEEVLGRALHELGVADRVMVVTKVQPLTDVAVADATVAAREIEHSVDRSRQRLRLDCLPLVLFHREADGCYLEELDRLKTKGWLSQCGVSCDNQPGPAAEFVADPHVSALQVPGNLLDRRHQHSGLLAEAAARDVAIFIRSVYLQGLLVMPEVAVPVHVRAVLPVRRKLAAVAHAAGMPLTELAIRYMVSQTGVTSLVIGVETVAQIRDNIELFTRGPLTAEVLAAADAVVPDLSEAIVTPSLWSTLEHKKKSLSLMKKKLERCTADNTYFNPDFHGALSCGIKPMKGQ